MDTTCFSIKPIPSPWPVAATNPRKPPGTSDPCVPGDLIVEVGANLGYFSLVLARAAGPSGRVISYEPDPDLGRILRRNAATNGYTNIDIRAVAVADRQGTMRYHRDRKSAGNNRLFPHTRDRDSFSCRW